MKQKFYVITLVTLVIGVISFSFKAKQVTVCKGEFLNYPSGPTSNAGGGYTGASWDASSGTAGATCSDCHNNTTAYGTTVAISLLSGATPVTSYSPGVAYNFHIVVTANTGTPSKFGFNGTCVTSTAHTNINKWGTMPTGTHNTVSSSRNYIEQSSARSATSTTPKPNYTVDIPWTAPVAGTGSVTFYVAAMATNGSGTGGDTPTGGVNLTVTESSTTPVKITEITATKSSTGVNVDWSVATEINTNYYTIEHSIDGMHFESLGKVNSFAVNSSNQHNYSYTHAGVNKGKHYYRVVEVDLDGTKTYSDIVNVNFDTKKSFTISPNPVAAMINLPIDEFTGSNYMISNMIGLRLATGKITNGKINVSALFPGSYVLTIIDNTGNIKTCRFIKE